MTDLSRVFPGGSEMAARMRAFDWSQTDLGLPHTWPQSLKVALGICLTSHFPLNVWWGRGLTLFYNDAYISFLGPAKHPVVLGRSGRKAWAEIWPTIGPMVERVFSDGIASWSEDIPMFFDRDLPQEEVHVTFSFSPIMGEGGTVEGMFCACTETTDKIVGNRRLETLRKLAVEATVARSMADACHAAATVMADNPHDLPVAAMYILDEEAPVARLAAVSGATNDNWCPDRSVPLDRRGSGWSAAFQSVLEFKAPRPLVLGSDIDRPGIVMPIPSAAQDRIAGFLVAGVSTHRPFDKTYRAFFELVAGHIATAIGTARAYEHARERADALARLDRAKTDFFSNVSHEFRTPLTLMLGPLEEELRENREVSPRVQIAHRHALRLLKLVNTLLDFSRIEAGRIEAVYAPTDLAALTRDLAGVFRSTIEAAGLRLTVTCASLPQPVYVDRTMWEKIVLNLLSNAFKFTFEGEISVTLHASGRRAELVVRDTGVGIPATELPRIFERFHRSTHTRSRTHEGTGIGLALVHQLVLLHGGEITVQSVEGAGTTFTISLPFGHAHLPTDRVVPGDVAAGRPHDRTAFLEEAALWLPEPVSQTSDRRLPPARTRGRILVVDDNADLRAYVRSLLAPEHDVVVATDGEAALAAVRDHRPDLVLADVMMPRLNGYAMVKRLRANPDTARMPIILLSARAGEEARIAGLGCGADDYLVKPFSARELLARVNTHLELAAARRAAEESLRRSKEELERRVRERTRDLEHAVDALQREVEERKRTEDQLRASEEKYRTLFNSIDEGFCVMDVLFDDTGQAVDCRFLEVNPSFGKQTSIFNPVGRTMREVAPQHEAHWFEVYGRVARTGEPLRFEIRAGELRRWYDVYAFRVGGPGSPRVAALFNDITERKRVEQFLRESQERQTFLLMLGDALREVRNSGEMQTVAARMLGEHLHADRVFYGDIHEETGAAFVHSDYFRNGLTTLVGQYQLADFIETPTTFKRGQPFCVADVEHSPGLSDRSRASYLAHQIRASVSVPLVKGGRLVRTLNVTCETPRAWRPEDIALVVQVAGRTWDAVERARAETALQVSEERLRALVESVQDYAIFTLDKRGRVTSWNEGARRITGYTEDEVLGECASRFYTPDDVAAGKLPQALQQALETGHSEDESWRVRKDGSRFWANEVVTPQRAADGTVLGFANVSRDLTERRRIEEALQRGRDELEERVQARTRELGALMKRLVNVQEEERRRIARDLHDDIGQKMTALHLKLAALARHTNEDDRQQQLRETQAFVLQLDRDMRVFAGELRSSSVYMLGLVAALHDLVEAFSRTYGITVDLKVMEGAARRFTSEIELNFYRIAQEAMHNAYKHAQAECIDVILQHSDGRLVLTVTDDGRGFDPDAVRDGGREGLGLIGMRERSALIGGRLEIESAPGHGTSIIVSAPVAVRDEPVMERHS